MKEQCNLSNEQISSNNNLLGLLGQSRVPFLLQVYLAAAVLFVLVMLAGIMMIASSLNSNVAQRTEFSALCAVSVQPQTGYALSTERGA